MEVAIAIRCGLCTHSEVWLKFMIFLAQFCGPHASETFLFASIENFGGVKVDNKSRFLWFTKFHERKLRKYLKNFHRPHNHPTDRAESWDVENETSRNCFSRPANRHARNERLSGIFIRLSENIFLNFPVGNWKLSHFRANSAATLSFDCHFSCNFSISAC